MVPPPSTDQDWDFDKFRDGSSEGKRKRRKNTFSLITHFSPLNQIIG